MKALFLFNLTDNMPLPWAEAGYQCYSIDLQHRFEVDHYGPGGNIYHLRQDVRDFIRLANPKDYAFIAAFIPCTHLAVSGARWFKGKGLRLLAESIELFADTAEFCEASEAPYFIENPVSTISTYWRKPDYTFQPWNYGDLWDKPTCLWTGGGFVMPPYVHDTRPEGVDRHKIHYASPGPDRANERSVTPPGFCRAVFEINKWMSSSAGQAARELAEQHMAFLR